MIEFTPEEQDVLLAFGLCPQCGSDDVQIGLFSTSWPDKTPQAHCGCLEYPFGEKGVVTRVII
jgi:hypothetical protein